MENRNWNGKRAWALAEWLTALALLGVIVAVALPNYFLSRTRSQASQVLADLRRTETAMVAFKMDNGRWIHDGYYWSNYAMPVISCDSFHDPFVWGHLTTPIAYLGSLPLDPFLGASVAVDYGGTGYAAISPKPYYWYYGEDGWKRAVEGALSIGADQLLGQWLMGCPGPDGIWGYGEWSLLKSERTIGFPRVYDPSNGSVSYGDIVRWENMDRTLVAPVE